MIDILQVKTHMGRKIGKKESNSLLDHIYDLGQKISQFFKIESLKYLHSFYILEKVKLL